MMRVLVRIFAALGFLTVLLFAGAIGVLIVFGPKKPELPQDIVLEFDFEQPLTEAEPDSPLAGILTPEAVTIRQVVEALDRAGRDPRVKGFIAKVGNPSQGIAETQELRDAVDRFRRTGRFALVHAETFGEFQNGMQSYYLAAGFEQIWMQPMGHVGITGLLSERPFYREALDKLRIVPQIGRRHEYKSAAEPYMERETTPASKEMMESLIDDLFSQMVESIAANRGLTVEAVNAAIDRAPLLDREALEMKLVDRLGYWDELVDTAKRLAVPAAGDREEPREAGLVPLLDYRHAAGPADDTGSAVALIVGEGAIERGESRIDPLSGTSSFGADDVAEALEDAIDNPAIKAILFRVNSPGGSAVGSERVRRQILRARAAGKPVLISMGNLAASGGYWVSMSADRIVALPGTLTGSIGVLGGKMVTSGLTDWLGIHHDSTARGGHAGIWSNQTPYTASELARRDALLDDIYAHFTQAVADGRKLPLETVRTIARGRVYTGRQARNVGLVDALGGYATALAEIRQLLKLEVDAPVRLVPFPQPKTAVERFAALLGGAAHVELGRQLLADALAEYRPLLARIAPALKADTESAILLMPPLGIAGY